MYAGMSVCYYVLHNVCRCILVCVGNVHVYMLGYLSGGIRLPILITTCQFMVCLDWQPRGDLIILDT